METTSIKWLTPDDLYNMLGISKQTQQSYRSKKTIPFSRVGKKIFYNPSEIDAWIKKSKVS